jgi:hypothetical protein
MTDTTRPLEPAAPFQPAGLHKRLLAFKQTFPLPAWPFLLLLAVLLFCEAGWLVALAPTDVARYECYGLVFWLGSHGATLTGLQAGQCSFLTLPSTPALPFHLLPLEYPPLTIVIFSLPLLLPLPYYALGFALLMTLVAGGVYALLARSEARQAAPVFLLYLLLGAVAIFQERFDLLPAACTLLCLLAAERGRWRTAYIFLALGILLKLYPVVMWPALFLAEQRFWLASAPAGDEPEKPAVRLWSQVRRWHWQNSLLCTVLLVVVMGGFALLNVEQAIINPLTYFLARPPQIESLAGSLVWLGQIFGLPFTTAFTYGSLNISSSLVGLISPLATLLSLAGLLLVLWLQVYGRIGLAQALVGLLCVLVATGKVFSPQYLIWLFPLLAYTFARGGASRLWMSGWAIIALLTTLIYVGYYSRMPDPDTASVVVRTLPGFFVVVALRNGLVLLCGLAFLLNWWGTRPVRAKLSG